MEASFPSLQNNSTVGQQLVAFFGSPDILRAFRKSLHRRISEALTVTQTADLGFKQWGKEGTFIPSLGDGTYRTLAPFTEHSVLKWLTRPYPFVGRPLLFSVTSRLTPVIERIEAISSSVVLLGWLFYGMCRRQQMDPVQRRIAVQIISPERQFANDVQSFDFLVDGKTVTASDMVILFNQPLSAQHRQKITAKGIVVRDGLAKFIDASVAKSALQTAMAICRAAFSEPSFWVKTAVETLYYGVKWQSILRFVSFDHYVTYSDMGLQSIPRNVVLRSKEIQSWYYMDSNNLPHHFESPKRPLETLIHHRSSYLDYDHFVAWTQSAADFFLRQKCRFGTVHVVGCLWASHVEEYSPTEARTQLRKALGIDLPESMQCVAVFDSTYHDDSYTRFSDGAAFLEKLLDVADACPDILWICKQKKLRPGHPLKAIYSRLQTHPRFATLPSTYSTSVLIAGSNRVVSFPYTSTSFEALSVNKAAVYFDPTGFTKGTPYERLGSFVLHTESELLHWVQTEPPSPVDLHGLDMLRGSEALNRFRRLLADPKTVPSIHRETAHA